MISTRSVWSAKVLFRFFSRIHSYLTQLTTSYFAFSYGRGLLADGHTVKAGFLLGASVSMAIARVLFTIPQRYKEGSEPRELILIMFKQTQENISDVLHYSFQTGLVTLVIGVAIGTVGAGGFAAASFAKNYFNK